MTSSFPAPTFRDPAGSLRIEDDRAIRTIHPSAREAVLEFVASDFYRRVRERGDMVGTVVDDTGGDLRLIHPRIEVPTYPWEWTPSQWLAAAELTIALGQEGLADGWILKDATPLNILFLGRRPVLVDVLSFERRDPASPIWLAYGQYVRTFLLPLVMNRLLNWPLTLTFFKRDGYEPQELYPVLNWPQRLSRAAFWPVTLAAALDKKKGGDAAATVEKSRRSDPQLTAHLLERSMTGLLRRTRRAAPAATASDWSDYKANLTHYTAAESARKYEWVGAVFAELHPRTVLDIGANTGEYSALAANSGAKVIALERDSPAADRLFVASRDHKLDIQTILADLARPTPPAGWDLSESSALLPRLEGRCELAMMLAVIHHLLLIEQIPIPAILALCHRLTLRWLIVEWVPVSDPMFQTLMRGRGNLYGALSDADLLAACNGLFTVMRRETLGNGRILFLFEKI